jgi:hypothetical protein
LFFVLSSTISLGHNTSVILSFGRKSKNPVISIGSITSEISDTASSSSSSLLINSDRASSNTSVLSRNQPHSPQSIPVSHSCHISLSPNLSSLSESVHELSVNSFYQSVCSLFLINSRHSSASLSRCATDFITNSAATLQSTHTALADTTPDSPDSHTPCSLGDFNHPVMRFQPTGLGRVLDLDENQTLLIP